MKTNCIVIFIFLLVNSFLYAGLEEDFSSALAKFKNNDFKSALEDFSNIRKNYKEGVKYDISLYYLAKCYEKSGFKTEAIKFYKEFLTSYPNSTFCKIVKYQYDKLISESCAEPVKTNEISIKKLPLIDEDFNIISKEDKLPISVTSDTNYFILRPKFNFKTYIVKKGETLWDIAKKIYGDGSKYSRLAELNNMKNLSSFSEGDTIIIDGDADNTPKEFVEKISLVPKPLQLSEEDIQNVEDILNIANYNFERHNYKEAIIYYLKYISKVSYKENTYQLALYNLAVSCHFLNDISNAIKHYKAYIELYNTGTKIKEVYFNLGKIYFEILKNYGDAKYYFDRVLTYLPEDELNKSAANYLKLLSRINSENLALQKTENISEAEIEPNQKKMREKGETLLASEIEVHKKESEKYNFKPKLSIDESMKKIDETIKQANMTAARSVAEFSNSINRIDYVNTSFLTPVREEKKRVKEMNFEDKLYNYDAEYFNKKGFEYKIKGMYDEAMKEYNKAIQYFPNDPLAYNNIAYLYAELGTNLNEAENLVSKALNLDIPRKGYYLDTLGWIYYQQGEFLKAKDTLEKAIFFKDSQLKRYHLGLVLKQLKMFDQANEQFQKAVILEPNTDIAFKAKLELKLLE